MSLLRKYETKFKIKLNVEMMDAGDMGRAFTCAGAIVARVAASPPQVTSENNRDG
jgi:hypothetical protein